MKLEKQETGPIEIHLWGELRKQHQEKLKGKIWLRLGKPLHRFLFTEDWIDLRIIIVEQFRRELNK